MSLPRADKVSYYCCYWFSSDLHDNSQRFAQIMLYLTHYPFAGGILFSFSRKTTKCRIFEPDRFRFLCSRLARVRKQLRWFDEARCCCFSCLSNRICFQYKQINQYAIKDHRWLLTLVEMLVSINCLRLNDSLDQHDRDGYQDRTRREERERERGKTISSCFSTKEGSPSSICEAISSFAVFATISRHIHICVSVDHCCQTVLKYSSAAITFETMSVMPVIPSEHLLILMGCSLLLTCIFLIQLSAGLCNLVVRCYCQRVIKRRHIFNLYLFHHLIICTVRSLIIFLACLSIVVTNQCFAIEFPIHFLLLLSTFDLLLIVIGETVHFWDSAINHRSTLHSRCCLVFGMLFNYFASSMFLSIHITMTGDHPVLMDLCETTRKRFFLTPMQNDERSLMPTFITYALFILSDLLTVSWIYISYREILNLNQKRLVSLFFHALIFTEFKEYERTAMVNWSLKRLRTVSISVLSNIIVILPVLTIRVFDLQLTEGQRLFFIYLTMLPWLDSITFLFYAEIRSSCCCCCSRRRFTDEDFHRLQRIGRRLSAYRENKGILLNIENKWITLTSDFPVLSLHIPVCIDMGVLDLTISSFLNQIGELIFLSFSHNLRLPEKWKWITPAAKRETALCLFWTRKKRIADRCTR